MSEVILRQSFTGSGDGVIVGGEVDELASASNSADGALAPQDDASEVTREPTFSPTQRTTRQPTYDPTRKPPRSLTPEPIAAGADADADAGSSLPPPIYVCGYAAPVGSLGSIVVRYDYALETVRLPTARTVEDLQRSLASVLAGELLDCAADAAPPAIVALEAHPRDELTSEPCPPRWPHGRCTVVAGRLTLFVRAAREDDPALLRRALLKVREQMVLRDGDGGGGDIGLAYIRPDPDARSSAVTEAAAASVRNVGTPAVMGAGTAALFLLLVATGLRRRKGSIPKVPTPTPSTTERVDNWDGETFSGHGRGPYGTSLRSVSPEVVVMRTSTGNSELSSIDWASTVKSEDLVVGEGDRGKVHRRTLKERIAVALFGSRWRKGATDQEDTSIEDLFVGDDISIEHINIGSFGFIDYV